VDQQGGWKRFGERTIYAGPRLRLTELDVEAPSGERFGYPVVQLPRIAVALITNAADEVLMLWRYRVPTDRWGYELLGGLVQDGEDPAGAAAREAREESGWAPIGRPDDLIAFEPLPGNLRAPVEVFHWRDAEHVGEPTDVDEAGRVEWVPLARVPRLIADGQVLGVGSLVPLLHLLARPAPDPAAPPG
jgi:ADP-ribose pyrophosphatase